MHHTTLYIDPVGATQVGFAQAMGMPGDVRFDFKAQSGVPYAGVVDLYPQLVLRPFTKSGVHATDIVIDAVTGASGLATVPGTIITDRFSIEVDARNSDGRPQRMLATGRLDLTGYAYQVSGPLGPTSYPTGPEGPAGPAGAAGAPGAVGPEGVRGSRWYTGAGPPATVPDDRVPGDMWLDETSGNVWRWDGTTWVGYVRA